jgi:hypothetical protein
MSFVGQVTHFQYPQLFQSPFLFLLKDHLSLEVQLPQNLQQKLLEQRQLQKVKACYFFFKRNSKIVKIEIRKRKSSRVDICLNKSYLPRLAATVKSSLGRKIHSAIPKHPVVSQY